MSEGRNLKFESNIIEKWFDLDENGALMPKRSLLDSKGLAAYVNTTLGNDNSLVASMIGRSFSTDVTFAQRLDGSTPSITAGFKLFGGSPINDDRAHWSKRLGMNQLPSRQTRGFINECARRAHKITSWTEKNVRIAEEIQPKDDYERAILEVEKQQSLTGGGFDNTEAFSITRGALNFLNNCYLERDFSNSQESAIWVDSCMKIRNSLQRETGVALGTLRITGFNTVRDFQETDGMLSFPVYKKALGDLGPIVAKRLSRWSGVDCRWLVGQQKKDELTGLDRVTNVADALSYILDHSIATSENFAFCEIVNPLARIQSHGFKYEEGSLKAKNGKARNVSPPAAIAGAQEAMVGYAWNEFLKQHKCSWMPSLQDHDTAVSLIRNWYETVLVPNEMRALPIDWDSYDQHVMGWALATFYYYVVRPFFHFEDQKWVDWMIVTSVYKYFLLNVECCEKNSEVFDEVKKKYSNQIATVFDGQYILIGCTDGLGSGRKFTHTGGSGYGEALQLSMQAVLAWKQILGLQGGDDVSLAVETKYINVESAEQTLKPIEEAGQRFNAVMKWQKVIWAPINDEVVNIFLQKCYHFNLGIWGIGSIARPYAKVYFTERQKDLNFALQEMASISKMNNGANNPFVRRYVSEWLEEDEYLRALFKNLGKKAFEVLIETSGMTTQEIISKLELTWNWGLKPEDFERGNIPILDVMSEVAADMSSNVNLDDVLKLLGTTTVIVGGDGRLLPQVERIQTDDEISSDNDMGESSEYTTD